MLYDLEIELHKFPERAKRCISRTPVRKNIKRKTSTHVTLLCHFHAVQLVLAVGQHSLTAVQDRAIKHGFPFPMF